MDSKGLDLRADFRAHTTAIFKVLLRYKPIAVCMLGPSGECSPGSQLNGRRKENMIAFQHSAHDLLFLTSSQLDKMGSWG